MYWPVSTAKRLHLSPSGLHQRPPAHQEEAVAAKAIADAAGPPTAGPASTGFQLSNIIRGKSPKPTESADTLEVGSAIPESGPSSSKSANGEEEAEEIVDIARSRNGSHWATLSRHTIALWSTRPAQVIAAVRRTRRSVEEYGANKKIHWQSNGLGLVIETTGDRILLYNVSFLSPSIFSYVPPSGTGSKSSSGDTYAPAPNALHNAFALAAGEHASSSHEEVRSQGLGRGRSGADEDGASSAGSSNAEMCELTFRLVLNIEAGLSCCTPTETHLLVCTKNPPAIQAMPWPAGPNLPGREGARPRQETGRPSVDQEQRVTKTALLQNLDWLQLSASSSLSSLALAKAEDIDGPQEASRRGTEVYIQSVEHCRGMAMYVWITSDGRAHSAHLDIEAKSGVWRGRTFHGLPKLARPRRKSSSSGKKDTSGKLAAIDAAAHAKAAQTDGYLDVKGKQPALDGEVPDEQRALQSAVNARFSLIALGLQDGTVAVYTYRSADRIPTFSHTFSIQHSYKSTASYTKTGPVTSLSWTSDGHALAVAWEGGWGVWSTYGKLMACSLRESWHGMHKKFMDTFLFGAKRLFWAPGNTELFFLAKRKADHPLDEDNQLFVLPFAKSAIATQHSPDNARYAFVQMDDSVLVYRGSEQPDMSIINPESDIWHHIKIPQKYLAYNWPIRYASISSDGKLIAVAGRRGLAHYSTVSGRWKTYSNIQQEQAFAIRGGLQWFHHVLVAACDCGGEYQIRMYSRDLDVDNSQLLHVETVNSPILLTSLFEDSLLVYTADNAFYHYLITTTSDTISLKLSGSITFDGVVGEPGRVRGMSWMVPASQQEFGDPVDDLTVAAIIFLIDGKLVLLRPRRLTSDEEEVSYDMQILADQVEFYWTHLQGIGALENSLWGYDGKSIKVWLNALTLDEDRRKAIAGSIDSEESDIEDDDDEYHTIEESVTLSLDFYPLCVLMEKGIIIGVDPETSLRKTLDFATFRSSTNTHLFIQQVLRYLLEKRPVRHAVGFASNYSKLIYFAHAIEVLLHDVLEDEADAVQPDANASVDETAGIILPTGEQALLPNVIEFLDHFDDALRIVVNCARKTELTRWDYLFNHAGSPVDLFEKCLEADDFRTAASYLLVLHSLESAEQSTALTVRLLRKAAAQHKWALCGDVLRFLRSVDESGTSVKEVIIQAGLLEGISEDVNASTPLATNGYHVEPDTPQTARPGTMESPSIVIDSSPLLTRSSSASAILDPTIEEDEEDEEDDGDAQHALDYGSPRRNTAFSGGTTLQAPHGAGAARTRAQRRISVPVAQPGADSKAGAIGNRLLRAASPLGNAVSGLGMSLSKVGLRSSEHLSGQSPSGSRSNSLLSPIPGPGRSRSPGALNSASPTRTVEEFVIE